VYNVFFNAAYNLSISFYEGDAKFDPGVLLYLVYLEEINHRDETVYSVKDGSSALCTKHLFLLVISVVMLRQPCWMFVQEVKQSEPSEVTH